MRTLGLAVVQNFAFVAAHALRHDDFALTNRAPFAGIFAERASAALRPPLNLEHGKSRNETERRAERAKESAIQIANKNARYKQNSKADP